MRRATNRRRTAQRGAYLVETSLIIVAFLAMLMFVMDFGRVLLTQQYITERARAGARYAAVHNWDTTAVKNYICYNSSSAPSGGGSGMFGLQPSQVQVTQKGSGSPFGSAWDDSIQISVSGVSILKFVPYFAGSFTSRTVTITIPAGGLGSTS